MNFSSFLNESLWSPIDYIIDDNKIEQNYEHHGIQASSHGTHEDIIPLQIGSVASYKCKPLYVV